jgi:hypothetical protein
MNPVTEQFQLDGLTPNQSYTLTLKYKEHGCSHEFSSPLLVQEVMVTADIDGNAVVTLDAVYPGPMDIEYSYPTDVGGTVEGIFESAGSLKMDACCVPELFPVDNDAPLVFGELTLPTLDFTPLDTGCVLDGLCTIMKSIDNGILLTGGLSPADVQAQIDANQLAMQTQVDEFAMAVQANMASSAESAQSVLADVCSKIMELQQLLATQTGASTTKQN